MKGQMILDFIDERTKRELKEEDEAEQNRTEQREAPLSDKVEESIKAIKLAAEMSMTYYNQPLMITYSGGKDSDVLLNLAESCLSPSDYEVLNSHTSVDAPETVYHIRKTFKRLHDKGVKATVYQPRDKDGNPITMWNLIPKKGMPPTRLQRYCCAVLKEASTPERICAVGVREAESAKRKGRDIFNTRGKKYADALFFSLEHAEEVHREAQEINDDNWDCTLIETMKKHGDIVVNPIYWWSDADIWQYIKDKNMIVNPLYQNGYNRVGCIGCPMATYKQVMKQFSDYPTYKEAYIKAFQRMLNEGRAKGKMYKVPNGNSWEDGQAVFDWWIEKYKIIPKGQMKFEI